MRNRPLMIAAIVVVVLIVIWLIWPSGGDVAETDGAGTDPAVEAPATE